MASVPPCFPARAPYPSLLTLSIVAALLSPSLYAAEETLVVDSAASDKAQPNESEDYSVKTTSAGSKMTLVPRDIPQSVSIISEQRMRDQQLDSLGDMLTNTAGISESRADSDRSLYYARGFQIDNYMVDNIATYFEPQWNLGDALSDTALYQRIEVVRGATGLMTGTGNPSAAINMVRKHADNREFTGNLSAEYGNWNKQRYVADLSAPLIASGNLRGRLVTGYQDNDSWLERYNQKKAFLSGILDADLSDTTRFSVGYEYQQTDINHQTWGGIPRWYADGGKTRYNHHFSTAPDWAYNDKTSRKVFATLQQRFANNWELTLNGTHSDTTLDSKAMYIDGFFDRQSGIGVGSYVGGTGYNTGKRRLDALDLFASGPFQLFGQQHQLMVGTSYSKQHNRYFNDWDNITADQLGNINQFNSNFPETRWKARSLAQDDTIRHKSAYLATRLTLADPLHLIVGARYTQWLADTMTVQLEQNRTSPYAGLVYDINEAWSTYASYTSIFQPQTKRNLDGRYLTPATGENYELGLKGDWMNGRLTSSLALFRIKQNNLAQNTGLYIPGTSEQGYRAVDGTVSKGAELELSGALTDNWQITLGATRYLASDNQGKAVNPQLPRTTVKLFTRYRLPTMPQLTLGGGVNWQNKVWSNIVAPEGNGSWRAQQSSYALVDLFGRYQLTPQLALQANVSNLFDKRYDTNIEGSGMVYGAPRSLSVSASYRF